MEALRPIDFDLWLPKTSAMAPRHRVVLSLIAGGLMLACSGCSLFKSNPTPANSATQQQELQAYIRQQTAFRDEASRPDNEHCDELVAAPPGVEEVRSNQSQVDSRQWTLISNGSDRHWIFVRTADGAPGGWAPKPGIDKLDFQPPLEPALTTRSSMFLAYARVDDPTESQRFAAMRDSFGVAQGTFTWRGHKYAYTLAPDLPCFPRLQ